MSDLAWLSPLSFLAPYSGLTGGHGAGLVVPHCWGFIVPAFVGLLLSLPYILSSGFLAAALVAGAGIVLLALWTVTGLYQLNRIGAVCLGVAVILVCGRVWRWSRWRLARRRREIPLDCLRREDESWAGFSAAWLGELSSRGVRVAPGLVSRAGTGSAETRMRIVGWPDSEAHGRLLTSNVEDGAFHQAVLTLAGAAEVVIDKLGVDPQWLKWRRLCTSIEGSLGEPAVAEVEVRHGEVRLTGIQRAGAATAEEWWTSVGLADLDPMPIGPLEASLMDAHGPVSRILLGPYVRLGIIEDEAASTLVGRVDGRTYLSTRLPLVLAGAGLGAGKPDARQFARWVGAYWRWPRRALRTILARPEGGAAIDPLAEWIYGAALPDLHALAFLKSLLLARPPAETGGWRHLEVALGPEAKDLVAFRRSARAVVEAPAEGREKALRAFLDRYGHLGPGERSLHQPRLGDDPAGAIEWLERLLSVENGLKDRGGRARRLALLDPRLGLAAWISRRQTRLRDAILKATWDLRKRLLAIGREAASAGALAAAEDVFFLDANELASIESAAPSFGLARKVAERRASFEEASRHPYAPFWKSSSAGAEVVRNGAGAVLAVGEALRGTPASPGRASGRAWVALDPSAPEAPPRGAIVVLPGAGPEWAFHLDRAVGVVTERGGALSHLAIVSREMSVPAAMGVSGATERITTGMEIELDGEGGVVRRIA